MKTRSTCATSCRSWGTSPRGCTGAWPRRLRSETGAALARATAASPEPGTLMLVALKIGFAECFFFCSSLHALPQLCPSPPKPNALLKASPRRYARPPASLSCLPRTRRWETSLSRRAPGISQAFCPSVVCQTLLSLCRKGLIWMMLPFALPRSPAALPASTRRDATPREGWMQPLGRDATPQEGCNRPQEEWMQPLGRDVTPQEGCDPLGRLQSPRKAVRRVCLAGRIWASRLDGAAEEVELLIHSPPPAAPTKTKTKLSASCSS